jgi:diketogulonate reductase-like aldo/keto reductase
MFTSPHYIPDTASGYGNESFIGEALRDICPRLGIEERDILITTKLAPKDHGFENTLSACEASLHALGRQQLDLYLVHWPGVKGWMKEDPRNICMRSDTWAAMEQLLHTGKTKAIGVSNYTIKHLEELVTSATVKPHVLQSECHPLLNQRELRLFCERHGIFFQAYSSLGTGDLLHNTEIKDVARLYSKSPSQLLLRWAVQQGIGVIPKSSDPDRVVENAAIFDFVIEDEHMKLLNELDRNHHFCWDPNDVM